MKKATLLILAMISATAQANRLDSATALTAANAAIAACEAKGIPVTATIVDDSGYPTLMVRADKATFIGVEGSYRKAYTVAMFGGLKISSKTFRDYAAKLNGLNQFKDVIALAGGLPIVTGNDFIAAIGVSGAPSDEVDEECAAAGLKAIEGRY